MFINFHRATFLKSAPTVAICPPDTGIEVAFVGRSNSGKSSAINTLTNQRLARTSKLPGRTQLINFFALDDTRRLVDLPGYGYAQVPLNIKEQIQKILNTYLVERHCLAGLILMMDIRHPLTPHDEKLLTYTLALKIPVHVLLTKADKLKRGAASNALLMVRQKLAAYPGSVTVQTFSSLKKQGIDLLESKLNEWMNASPDGLSTNQEPNENPK